MPKPGFKRNSKTVANILHNDPGGQAAVMAAAEQIKAQIEANGQFDGSHSDEVFISEYHTDRYVAGVNVPADDQAKYGTGTRAAQQVAGR